MWKINWFYFTYALLVHGENFLSKISMYDKRRGKNYVFHIVKIVSPRIIVVHTFDMKYSRIILHYREKYRDTKKKSLIPIFIKNIRLRAEKRLRWWLPWTEIDQSLRAANNFVCSIVNAVCRSSYKFERRRRSGLRMSIYKQYCLPL